MAVYTMFAFPTFVGKIQFSCLCACYWLTNSSPFSYFTRMWQCRKTVTQTSRAVLIHSRFSVVPHLIAVYLFALKSIQLILRQGVCIIGVLS